MVPGIERTSFRDFAVVDHRPVVVERAAAAAEAMRFLNDLENDQDCCSESIFLEQQLGIVGALSVVSAVLAVDLRQTTTTWVLVLESLVADEGHQEPFPFLRDPVQRR